MMTMTMFEELANKIGTLADEISDFIYSPANYLACAARQSIESVRSQYEDTFRKECPKTIQSLSEEEFQQFLTELLEYEWWEAPFIVDKVYNEARQNGEFLGAAKALQASLEAANRRYRR